MFNTDKYPLTPDAWELFTKPNTLGKHCYRQYVLFKDLVLLARALGRQVTLDELSMLAGLDGDEKVTCSATGEEFLPVGFIILTRKFLDRVARAKEVDISWAPAAGCFFVKKDGESEEILIVPGCPYAWDNGREFLAE